MIFGMAEISGLQTQVSILAAMQARVWLSGYPTDVGFSSILGAIAYRRIFSETRQNSGDT
jgi:hypothetical protein